MKKIIDVVIHTSKNINKYRKPIRKCFVLFSDLKIDCLPPDWVNMCLNACTPEGYKYKPNLQFGQLYSFIRESHSHKNDLQWDEDQRLQLCIALSRIVHPTSISFKYAARIIMIDNVIKHIIPGPVSGFGSNAFVIDTKNNYLTEKNAEDIKELLTAYDSNPLQDPFARSMWYYEYASRIYEIDVRWTLIVNGIEALIHTDRYYSTKQFVSRIQKLSKEVKAGDICKDEAEKIYDIRSSLSHGQGFSKLHKNEQHLYKKIEKILRLTIQKSIIDRSFNSFLSDTEQIKQKWPINSV